MRPALNGLAIEGTVVIGEGEARRGAHALHREKVGSGGRRWTSRSIRWKARRSRPKGGHNALAVGGDGSRGRLPQCARCLHGQDRRRASVLPEGVIDLDAKPEAATCASWPRPGRWRSPDIVACIPRSPAPRRPGSRAWRSAGARIMLISDGERQRRHRHVAAGQRVDIYLGSGGAPEGVLAAAALRCNRRADAGTAAVSQRRRARAQPRNGASPDLSRKYACSTWPRATSCSPPPVSPMAHAKGRAAIAARRHHPIRWSCARRPARSASSRRSTFRTQGLVNA